MLLLFTGYAILDGGALFAAFPMVYATVFYGFFLAFMLLLVALFVRRQAASKNAEVKAQGMIFMGS